MQWKGFFRSAGNENLSFEHRNNRSLRNSKARSSCQKHDGGAIQFHSDRIGDPCAIAFFCSPS